MGSELDKMDLIAATIADCPTWQSWVGGADSAVWLARVVTVVDDLLQPLPMITVAPANGIKANKSGADTSANFRSTGSIMVRVYAEDVTGSDIQASVRDFAGKFFPLLNELVERAHTGQLYFDSITYGNDVIAHSDLNSEQIDGAVWRGEFAINWGV